MSRLVSGRIQKRLVGLLASAGFSEVRLYAAQGVDRWDVRRDVCRWEGSASKDGVTVRLMSWDTMTNCCKHGIAIDLDGPQYNVSAKHG